MGKKNSGSPLLIGIAIVIGLLASIPKQVWLGLAVTGAVGVVVWMFLKRAKNTKVSPEPIAPTSLDSHHASASPVEPTLGGKGAIVPGRLATAGTAKAPSALSNSSTVGSPAALVSITVTGGTPEREYGIPVAPTGGGKAQWVPPGQRVTVAGLELPDGMVYVGAGLRTGYQDIEPALINPSLKVASDDVDWSLPLTDYWPSYSTISFHARKAYLSWLASGRNAPSANIGYVFLFFYGLERRILLDAQTDPVARAEIPVLKAEIERLLTIYGGNHSFRRYAAQLLGFLASTQFAEKSYLAPPPPVTDGGYELPFGLRVGLGQLAVDQKPVPADWALAWALSDPNIVRRTPITRCADIFGDLFKEKYTAAYGAGLMLKVNRTRLRASYTPASSSLRYNDFSSTIADLPDVSAVKTPVAKLQQLVDECATELDPYSRYLGRNPDKAQALEGLLQLPVALWPADVRTELEDLKIRVGNGLSVMTFGELSGRLKSAGTLSRDKVLGLARALEGLHLGIEPDVLGGAKTPKGEDKIALFATPPDESAARNTPAYAAAVVTLDLACAAAFADGEVSAHELVHLTRQINSWAHLSNSHRQRLKAHLRLGIDQPSTLASLKKKLEPLPAEAKRSIGRFLAHLTQVDGQVAPEEVKFLERVYKTLSINAQLLYSDLHSMPESRAQATSPVATSASGFEPTSGITLNAERIAQLQKETEAVSALLAGVFAEEQPVETIAEEVTSVDEPPQVVAGILGLNPDHSAFVRRLVSRHSWPKADLIDVAADMELMLDGTLEHINEAMLDRFDAPLTEGDDPIEINQELLEHIPS